MTHSTSGLNHPAAAAVEPPKKAGGSQVLRMVLFALVGAILGFGYYRFVGCRTGACPITGNPYVSTLYGAMLGVLMAR